MPKMVIRLNEEQVSKVTSKVIKAFAEDNQLHLTEIVFNEEFMDKLKVIHKELQELTFELVYK